MSFQYVGCKGLRIKLKLYPTRPQGKKEVHSRR